MLEDRQGRKYTNYNDMVPIRSDFYITNALLTRHPIRLNSANSLGKVRLICTKYWYYKHGVTDKNKYYKSCTYFFPCYIKHLQFKCPFFQKDLFFPSFFSQCPVTLQTQLSGFWIVSLSMFPLDILKITLNFIKHREEFPQ